MKIDQLELEKFEAMVQKACADQKEPGVIILVKNDQGTVYEKCFGTMDVATGAPCTIDTVVQLMSMTKAFTALACMMLVEKGKLNLDTPVGEYVDAYKNPLVLTHWDEDGIPQLRRAKTDMTLRKLLSHTGGQSHEAYDPVRFRWNQTFGVEFGELSQHRAPLTFDPGTDWAYGQCMDLVMECILAVDGNGRSWEQYLKDRIFTPLQLTSTSFFPTPEMVRRTMPLHFVQEDGSLLSNTTEDIDSVWYGKGYRCAGREACNGLWSTARDYQKLLSIFIGDGVSCNGIRFLQKETIDEMRRNQIGDLQMHWGNGEPPCYTCFATDPDFFYGQQPAKWGLGFMVNEKISADGRGAGSLAWWGGGDTFFVADPDNRLSIVVLMQNMPAARPISLNILRNTERQFHGLPVLELEP